MKSIILTILISLLVCGCAGPTSEQQAKFDYGEAPGAGHQEKIKHWFENYLKDPYSAHYDFAEPEKGWTQDAPIAGGKFHPGWLVRVKVNAKNSYGGYTGNQLYTFIMRGDEILKVRTPATGY